MFWTHVFPYIAAAVGIVTNHKLRGTQLSKQTKAFVRTTLAAKAMIVSEITTRDTHNPHYTAPQYMGGGAVAPTPDSEDVRIRQP